MADEQSECRSCFNSSNFPGVQISPDGLCNACVNAPSNAPQSSKTTSNLDELRQIAEQLKVQRQNKYDCIVGASGGLDSSYVLYVAKRLLDLNPLVVSYDSGFTYPHAKENLHNLCSRLNLDLRIVKSKAKNDWKHLRSMLRALEPLDAYWGLCRFCHFALTAVLLDNAIREKIFTTLVSSNSYESLASVPDGFRMEFMLRSLRNQALWAVPKVALHLAIAEYYLMKFKLEFYIPPLSNLLRRSPQVRGMQRLNITRYVPWNVDEMVCILSEEAGWKSPRTELPMRFDCLIEEAFINHTYKKSLGCSVHAIICNNLIHAGIRTKSDLQQTLTEIDASADNRMKEVRCRLSLERPIQKECPLK